MKGKTPFLQFAAALLVSAFFSSIPAIAQSFFPAGSFDPDNVRHDSFMAGWYSTQLTALQESSLLEAKNDPSAQIYRFLWLRSFHRPVAIRVEVHPDGAATVVTKIADGAGGYMPGKLSVDKTEQVPAMETNAFLGKIGELKYWTLPERDPERPGLDGAQWVIEGIDHGKYRVVDRWTPKNGAVRELGLYFLRKLSKLDLKNEPIY